MPELDGTAKHTDFLTPYDAHEKVVRNSGEYEHQEFPRVLEHVQKTDGPEGHFEVVLDDGSGAVAEEEEE